MGTLKENDIWVLITTNPCRNFKQYHEHGRDVPIDLMKFWTILSVIIGIAYGCSIPEIAESVIFLHYFYILRRV